MAWQDWVFAVGGLIILVSLVPTIRGAQKPALATSVMTTFLVCIFTFTMATLDLWLAALMNGLTAGAWAILAYQRYQMDAPSHRLEALEEIREELLDLPSASEGS